MAKNWESEMVEIRLQNVKIKHTWDTGFTVSVFEAINFGGVIAINARNSLQSS